jgi:hypothetical protein
LAAVAPRNALSRVVDSNPFTVVVVATIAVNAVVLGLQTYEELESRWGTLLNAVNAACVAVFIVELGFSRRRRSTRKRVLSERILILRRALDDLELELALESAPAGGDDASR